MDGRTDGQLRLNLLGRLAGVDLKCKNSRFSHPLGDLKVTLRDFL